jgi:putative FmdB family regulatory protein
LAISITETTIEISIYGRVVHMPIYEYKCAKCGKEFEKVQRITDEAVLECEFCHGTAKRLISRSSFVLKGSGWYVTDYGGKKPNYNDSKDEKPSASTTESTSDTTSSANDKIDS